LILSFYILRFKETVMKQKPYNLEERLIHFAVDILKIAESLPQNDAGRYFRAQMIRSGSSPALNYGEAQAAESRRDFAHKMQIVLKELRETQVSLKILLLRGMGDKDGMKALQDESGQLVAICTTIVSKVKQKR
jgi:four helix bundle protein